MNISLPDEITQAMTRGVARGVEEGGYVHNVGDVSRLQQVRAADAMLAAAENPGGSAMGDAMQMGMGIAMAGQMANTDGRRPCSPARSAGRRAGVAPPPLPGQALYHVDIGGQAGGPVLGRPDPGRHRRAARSPPPPWCGPPAWPAGPRPARCPALAPLFEGPPPMPPSDAADRRRRLRRRPTDDA